MFSGGAVSLRKQARRKAVQPGGIHFRTAAEIPSDGLYMTNLWYEENVL